MDENNRKIADFLTKMISEYEKEFGKLPETTKLLMDEILKITKNDI